jgi:hypothetical protein
VDWAEAALVLVLVIVGLVLLPVSLATGSVVYANQEKVSNQQSATRHGTTAILLADAAPTSIGTRGQVVTGTSMVRARWTLPDGTERVGPVKTDNGTTAGSPLRIWLDGSGNPAEPPVSHEEAVMSGVATVLAIWIIGGCALGLVVVIACAGLNWYRSTLWQRKWAQVEPGWLRHV